MDTPDTPDDCILEPPPDDQPAGEDSHVGKLCPYCRFPIQAGERVVVCPECGMPHHQGCWYDNGRCTTYGCTGTADRLADSFRGRVRPFPEVWGERLAHWRRREGRRQPLFAGLDPVKWTLLAIGAIAPVLVWLTAQLPLAWLPMLAVCVTLLVIAWAYKRYPSAEHERDLILYTAFIGLTLVILAFILLSSAYTSG